MNDNTPGWLKQVQAEKDKVPDWLDQMLTHPEFAALHRRDDGWVLFTKDDQHIEAPELRELCQKFAAHYSR